MLNTQKNIQTSGQFFKKWSGRLLLLSGIVLWESLLGAVWSYFRVTYGDFESQGDYITGIVVNAQFGEFLNLGCAGLVLILIYTLLVLPRRIPHRYGVNYWLQVIIALVILGWKIQVFISEYGTQEVILYPTPTSQSESAK